jgi:multicomponent Na+:H+ antiporter subunit F
MVNDLYADLYQGAILFLLLNIIIGLARILRGPTPADRMLAGELLGTAAVAIVLLLAKLSGQAALVDMTLVFALLSAMAVVTFVSRAWASLGAESHSPGPEEPHRDE